MKKVIYHFEDEMLYESVLSFVRRAAPFRYAYAMKYQQKKDRYNVLMAYVLLCVASEQLIGELSLGVNGKPYFNKDFGQNYISISHTENMVVVAISDQNIGVDIEQYNKVNYEIVSMVCSKKEQYQIKENFQLPTLFWTAKESLSKLLNEDWYSSPMTELLYDGHDIIDRNNLSVHFEHFDFLKNTLCIASESSEVSLVEEADSTKILKFIT
ncbi:4'-phosphopantetheinyl transferase family protein [Clostridium estertheticum]|uniref:4'-phosphopantetheinyl transferase family protein n=1 Tax=Clostridium estertheticum TaxID=238834 RepID=UPI001C0BA0BA|nr:4'-phosphopantetheinyl transferase superfamily protein [Clostridium estertheticum]MBU3072713.1 4'-phosphopantetheinyl transferase superfamily protein [Clostridium estertheticum]MBU3162806.1 4'-phosphopantetheinyl transferase superfamily protein [Clostridium estertheticum]